MSKNQVSGKPELLKRINRNIIIKLIMQNKSISRSQISQITHLALPSVMRIVDGLIEEGLVINIGKGGSTGGRKPNLLSLNKDAMYIFGVEIAVNTVVILSDLAGNILDEVVIEQESHMTPVHILEKILAAINEMKDIHKLDESKIAGIGIGTPGSHFKHVHTMESTVLKGWEIIDVKAWFEDKLKFMVEVENVARTRTLGELWFGIGQEIKNFIYVFVDRGVGCGIVNKGIIFKGAHGVAGEFGHTTIELEGKKCYCGKKGCIEMYVSVGGIENAVHEALLKDIKVSSTDKMKFKDIITKEEEPSIAGVLEQRGKILGIGVSNLINVYNPHTVILGGELPTSCKSFTEAAMETIQDNIFNNKAVNTPVLVSDIGQKHACIGSIALVMDAYFKSVEL